MAPASSPRLAHLLSHTSDNSEVVSAATRILTPATCPIPLLPEAHVKALSVGYTVLVPVYYYLRSADLVRDPLSTLTYDLIPISITTSLFCALCLPSAGTWNSGAKDAGRIIEGSATAKTGKANGRKKVGKAAGPIVGDKDGSAGTNSIGESLQARILPTLFALILTSTLAPGPLALLALCLGAPIFPYSLLPHTFALAAHVSMLSVLPIFYTHGVSTEAWRDVAAGWLPFDEAGVWAGSVGAFVGGWIGAIPIALDWDREWQKWPCTVIWGLVLGWTAGRVLTNLLGLGIGRRIDMTESENAATKPAKKTS
ncbi:hypothetical protein DV735_g5146, partial [Chaetothyriales sp. CBS 134920]